MNSNLLAIYPATVHKLESSLCLLWFVVLHISMASREEIDSIQREVHRLDLAKVFKDLKKVCFVDVPGQLTNVDLG